ncbi:hypothetical protein [Methylobrevis pamukkalensis]|uniref:Uncharacterized protein n=1 Tax=Methylobrevis pamukkalensis TaxID=1439726 RepID=A0A1E3H1X1_9HYPH|nr:hypothetical protein [Methylobrevis pamukkalensis]ODN69551.1 hypothetical protein A6302_03145 [Methylobrevis pamukkalensis]
MTRYSCLDDDPGLIPYWTKMNAGVCPRIFLDGVEQHHCITADDEAKFVLRYKMDEHGKHMVDYLAGELITETLHGRVEFFDRPRQEVDAGRRRGVFYQRWPASGDHIAVDGGPRGIPMSHLRAEVRAAIVAAVTGLPLTGARVAAGRGKAMPASSMPFLRVRFRQEPAAPDTKGAGGGFGLMRMPEFDVVATAAGQDFEDVLDDIAGEIETAMAADPKFGGLALASHLVATTAEIYGAGDEPAGSLVLTYRVRMVTRADTPGTAG